MKKLESVVGHDDSVEDRIIDATVRCFRRFGINKTSMDDIAKAAKLSRPTIYRYFPSRHHLAVEVLVREVRDHTRLVVPILKEHPYPPRAMIEGILFAIATAKEHPYTSIIVSDAGSDLLAKVSGSDEATLAAMSELWLPSLMRWREDGYLRAELKMDDVLLWITLYMHTSLGKSFVKMTAERMRRMIATLVVPAIFDMEKLRQDFPDER
ncbi:MAG: TetR/AcrR family transcriptional regulator [Panacagrimonas sp.]